MSSNEFLRQNRRLRTIKIGMPLTAMRYQVKTSSYYLQRQLVIDSFFCMFFLSLGFVWRWPKSCHSIEFISKNWNEARDEFMDIFFFIRFVPKDHASTSQMLALDLILSETYEFSYCFQYSAYFYTGIVKLKWETMKSDSVHNYKHDTIIWRTKKFQYNCNN